MKIGAYQFAITKDIKCNLEIIKKAILKASQENIKFLVFPECSLTGYPPHDIKFSLDVDFDELNLAFEELLDLAKYNEMYLLVGTITLADDNYYNSAVLFTPTREKLIYSKRALWGWDKDNFSKGNSIGIFDIEGVKIGVRICFEVRFPEFFRELYKEKTDLNVILFYDISIHDDIDRYELIESHIRTRAAENVTYTLSVNTISPYQTAPTALYDKSGTSLTKLLRNEETLLIYDFEIRQSLFGEQGREDISDWLISRL